MLLSTIASSCDSWVTSVTHLLVDVIWPRCFPTSDHRHQLMSMLLSLTTMLNDTDVKDSDSDEQTVLLTRRPRIVRAIITTTRTKCHSYFRTSLYFYHARYPPSTMMLYIHIHIYQQSFQYRARQYNEKKKCRRLTRFQYSMY